MQVQACLNFAGRCEEALAFYKKRAGAEVTTVMRLALGGRGASFPHAVRPKV